MLSFYEPDCNFNDKVSHTMESMSISPHVTVSQCSQCQGDTEYHCRTCRQTLCPLCKRTHTLSLDTKDHDVTLYREKFNSMDIREMCATHPDQVYEMYCETCELPVCSHCPEHIQHKLQHIRTVYENKQKQNYDIVSNIRSSTLYTTQVLFIGMQAAFTSCKKEKISQQSSAMFRKSHRLTDLMSNEICGEISVECKCSLVQKLGKQSRITKRFLIRIQMYENKFENSACRPIKFLRFIKKTSLPKIQDRPYLTKQFLISLTPEINMESLIKFLSEIELTGIGKRRVGDEILLTQMPFPVLKKSFEVSGVNDCYQVSCALSRQLWVNDNKSIILLDTTTGNVLYTIELKDFFSGFDYAYKGIHTINSEFELIYIDRGIKINKLSKDRQKTTTIINNTDSVWEILCIYCSPCSGDLLVGMCCTDDLIGKVARYNNSGQLKQTIPHGKTSQTLYTSPQYVVENKNGDIVVSDYTKPNRAVVVTSRLGRYRFSYTGPPPSGLGLDARGICTDALSHILVCDWNTCTVQMIDKDGQFLSILLTSESPGIFAIPQTLSYDVNTHLLLVGSIETTLSIYRFIDKNLVLVGKSCYLCLHVC